MSRFAAFDDAVPFAMAHRGGALEAPENSDVAIAHTVNLGISWFETDARITKDGRVLCHHDATLDRTTDLTGPVSGAHWSVIRHASVIGADGVLGKPVLLEDVLGSFPELRINIDLKESAVVRPVADVIARTGSANRVCIGAFSGRRLAQIRALLGPDVATSMSPAEIARLVGATRSKRVARFVTPVAAVQVPASLGGQTIVDRSFVERTHALGMQVHVWTIDDPAQMNRLLDLGVDAIMTDRPSVLSELLRARET